MTPIPAGWKLVEALRESLLWTASSLAAVGKEQDVITLEGRKRTIGEILDEANAALDTSPTSVAPGDAQDGLAEAQRLAQALFQRHFAQDVDYASGRVKWEVLGDLPGVLSQIDNMVSGLVRPDAPAAGDAQTTAARDVLAERRRQIGAEGRSAADDDAYQQNELARAAACYAMPPAHPMRLEGALGVYGQPPRLWPWDRAWWKPTPNYRRRELVKAGALILAEIERLDRAAQQQGEA